MSKIDEDEAALALEGLQLMGQAYEDEVAAVTGTRIEARPPAPAGGVS